MPLPTMPFPEVATRLIARTHSADFEFDPQDCESSLCGVCRQVDTWIASERKKVYHPFVPTCLLFILVLAGCKMTAPIHTWKASKVNKDGTLRVAIGPIGIASRANLTAAPLDEDLQQAANRLQENLRSTQPILSQQLIALHPSDLERSSAIQLVSYDRQPNDSATLGAARNAGADFILQGNVVLAHLKQEPPQKPTLRSIIFGRREPMQHLTVHWTIIDVATGQRLAEETIALDRQSLQKKYPDLKNNIDSNDTKVLNASSRSAWELVASAPVQSEVMLDLPWVWAGSSQVRKGNAYARQGRWDLAEREWQDAAENHPSNTAAWHNLSLAAVAREDFELAKARIKHANSFLPGDPTYKTQLWIEQQQLHFHRVHQLPPPPEGWKFPEATLNQLGSNR